MRLLSWPPTAGVGAVSGRAVRVRTTARFGTGRVSFADQARNVRGALYSPGMVAWGDVPTWLAVAGGVVGGFAALRQLTLQRQQLADQKDVIARQTRLLERQQADAVDLSAQTINGSSAGVMPPESQDSVHMAVLTNGSARPLRNLACQIEAAPAGATVVHVKLADRVGELVDVGLGSGASAPVLVPGERTSSIPVLKVGRRGAFLWGFTTDRYPRPRFSARFTDDVGLHWQIDQELHLVKLENRDDW